MRVELNPFHGAKRTLAFTHVSENVHGRPGNLEACTGFYNNPPVHFDRKYWIYLEGGICPPHQSLEDLSHLIYSRSGAIDEPDAQLSLSIDELLAREYPVFVLGGGFLTDCLFKTFRSIAKYKAEHGFDLQVHLPLPLIYRENRLNIDRIDQEPLYFNRIAMNLYKVGRMKGYEVLLDNKTLGVEGFGNAIISGDPVISLRWHTTIAGLINCLNEPQPPISAGSKIPLPPNK
jgi:hypothetical protein